jgi:DNA sulfur modification protein DndE
MIETVRLSEKGKSQLVQIKRRTGLENWNVICRWALCTSLAEPSVPPEEEILLSSNIEMTWKTFAGQHEILFESLVKQRLKNDGIPTDQLNQWFNIHLHRGVSYLAKKTSGPSSFVY